MMELIHCFAPSSFPKCELAERTCVLISQGDSRAIQTVWDFHIDWLYRRACLPMLEIFFSSS